MRPLLPADPAELSAFGADIERAYQEAVAFRRRHSWLSNGQVVVLERDNNALTYRISSGEKACEVKLDLSSGQLTAQAEGDLLTLGRR